MNRFAWLSAVWMAGALALLLVHAPCRAAEPWWPIQVKSYYGRYDAGQKEPGRASASLDRARLEEWIPPASVERPYRLGVCFPHLKDSYWVGVNYGIMEEARRLGMTVELVVADGYEDLEGQIRQMRNFIRQKVDGIILAAVSYEGNDQVVEEARTAGIPVVEAVNDVRAHSVSAKSMVSFFEMGYLTGEFVAEHAEKAGLDALRVSFFPGPKQSGWAPETLEGFREAVEHFPGKVEIADVSWGDTGADVQRELLIRSLNRTGHVDYVVGNALAAEQAPEVLEGMMLEGRTSVVSTYIIPTLYDRILNGQVAGAPSDLTVFQGRMAVDMMARILSGEKPGVDFPFRSGPFIPMVTPENAAGYPYEGLFGPRDFQPMFSSER